MGFLPARPTSGPDDQNPMELSGGERSVDEDREERSVEAASERAREIARRVFGTVSNTSLTGVGIGGPFRGLLRLDVPFTGLDLHREREARFLAAVGADDLLARVPLLFVVGPEPSEAVP